MSGGTIVKPRSIVAALVAATLVTTGCSGRSGAEVGTSASTGGAAAGSAADFGDLKGVCQSGKPTSAPAQGVTASEIKVGVMSDVGFTKNPEFVDAAKVFTSWCNAAGGINGRKLVATTRDSKLMEVRQRVLEACPVDFALVGGGSALDALGVKERLSCLLPAFPAQVSQSGNIGSDLQVASWSGPSYDVYAGFHNWLLKEAYPESAGAVGIIVGDSPVGKGIAAQYNESYKAAGGTVSYQGLYPAPGVADWTPYAQAIKTKGVKGLVFLGDFRSLAKLEQVLTGINYKLDWIDPNSNSYGPAFLQLAGPALASQNNLADLSGVNPLEVTNPATQQVKDLYAKYAPQAQVTLPALRAFSIWLLFAKAAASCGEALTRTCVYDAARKQTAWTGGGLQAPVDLSQQDAPLTCFNVVKATPQGWQPADFKPNTGAYRCNAPTYKFTGNYGKPVTLADVGKSMSDVK
jgi:ABC-type branched-subunit amino acid transport system substrate-binding protein